MIMTPGYASPEQVAGDPSGKSGDIYRYYADHGEDFLRPEIVAESPEEGITIHVCYSSGSAHFEYGDTFETILARADEALFNRVQRTRTPVLDRILPPLSNSVGAGGTALPGGKPMEKRK